MGNQYGAYHLADNPSLYEPQRTNNFTFIVTDIDNILRVGVSAEEAEDSDYIKNASNTLSLSVVSASIPMFSQEPIIIRRGNSVMKVAGLPTFSDGSLEVYDYIGADSKSILMAWQNLSYNVNTEKVGLMRDYKKTCYLCEYDPDYKLVRTWKLLGCWVSSLSEDGFNQENGDKKVITAKIEYDKAFMEMPDNA